MLIYSWSNKGYTCSDENSSTYKYNNCYSLFYQYDYINKLTDTFYNFRKIGLNRYVGRNIISMHGHYCKIINIPELEWVPEFFYSSIWTDTYYIIKYHNINMDFIFASYESENHI